ncbi:uncharacterized protein ARMOST_11684 [Armillaria ostoyae]|uniref:Uncharacterized protein n=1 Tax=Armillaria ostoyae TaxID=47428 RepID=A0A284RHU5_ARMOS|nr:uncharacterized protein ARMOST_11684 [Armillaria ostoyae]
MGAIEQEYKNSMYCILC